MRVVNVADFLCPYATPSLDPLNDVSVVNFRSVMRVANGVNPPQKKPKAPWRVSSAGLQRMDGRGRRRRGMGEKEEDKSSKLGIAISSSFPAL